MSSRFGQLGQNADLHLGLNLQASLKQSQVELRDANKAAAAAAKTVESKVAELAKVKASLVVANSKASKTKPAPLPSVAALASRKRRSLTHDGSDPVPALDEDEEPAVAEEAEEADSPMEEEVVDDEEGDTSLEDLKAVAKSRAATKKVKASAPAPPPSPPISVPDDEEQEEEESYRPPAPKAKSRAAPKPKAKAVLADAEVAVEEDEPKAGKRKAGVLADKTANATKKTKVVKAEAGVGGKKKKAAAVAEEEQDEPAKKKKRTLFGGPKKFTGWGSIEVRFRTVSLSRAELKLTCFFLPFPHAERRRQLAGPAYQPLAR